MLSMAGGLYLTSALEKLASLRLLRKLVVRSFLGSPYGGMQYHKCMRANSLEAAVAEPDTQPDMARCHRCLDASSSQADVCSYAGERVWVATAAGQIEVLDIRAGRMSGALKGSTGSVRALDLHPTEPLIASVGLDRHLRLHNTATRKQVASVYMKQHLMDVTFCPSPAPQKEAKEGAAAEVPAEGQRAKAIKRHHKGVNCGAAL